MNQSLKVIRTQEEIDEVYEKAMRTQNDSIYKGLSYEDGLLAMLDWLTTPGNDNPMEE